jgi:ABC-2 type transport system permease protein
VSQAGTIAWFARHEMRLAWRDWRYMLTAGRRRQGWVVALGLIGLTLFLHCVAYGTFFQSAGLKDAPDKRMLVVITGMLALYGSLMLSQAVEAVTRAFYARADLDLILSSPALAWRVFAVRIAAMAVTIVVMSLALAAPFINVLAWLGGARWLAGYLVVVALAMIATAIAVAATAALFRAIGPKRTRLVAQFIAAVIGAGFVIGGQLIAILSYGTLSRTAFLESSAAIAYAPTAGSIIYWPARALLGDVWALAFVLSASVLTFGAAIYLYAPRFGEFALAAAGVSNGAVRHHRRTSDFGRVSPAQALRRKEWILLRRDPWLMSQSLMQLLYLLPPVFLLWRSFYQGGDAALLLVPILIMAAGQLAGGLAWLAISGEDAPDLIATAPIAASGALRAKTEAVTGGIAVVFGPCVMMLALLAPAAGLAALLGIAIAAGSATAIQFWFRAQAKRSHFRRRQTSSRIATIAEALSSTIWAGTGALAAAGTWLAVVPGFIAAAILAGVWLISPARS